MLKKIISGGQTGADQGGLSAGLKLGLETGGTIGSGFKTEHGPLSWLGTLYGLKEMKTDKYPPRTKRNVLDSDGTVIFGNIKGRGSKLTKRFCDENDKPCLVLDEFNEISALIIQDFVNKNSIETLNVAGNRESKNPGLHQKVCDFLVSSLPARIV